MSHARSNCLNDIIHEADEWAEEFDANPGAQTGLLAGIPISLKDHFSMKVFRCFQS